MAQKHDFIENLTDILVKQKSLSQEKAQDLKKGFKENSPENFEQYLLDSALVSKASLLKALSIYYQVPAFDVSGYLFEHDLLKEFPKDVMLRNRFIPVEVDEDILIVVASEPNDSIASTIEKIADYDVQFNVGIRRDIEDAIKEFYDRSITDDQEDSDPYFEWVEREELREKSLEDEEKKIKFNHEKI